MGDAKQSEEKIVLNSAVRPESYSPLYRLSAVEFTRVWDQLTKTGLRYALNASVDTDWFDVIDLTDNAEHEWLGLALRWIDLNSVGANLRDRYHYNEWNNLLNNTINTFTMFLMQYAVDNHHRSITSLLAAPCSVMMHGIIKLTLERLFDARNPDAYNYERIDILLNDRRRDSLAFSMSHACFSVGRSICKFTNACWGIGTEYDTPLCHYFRTVLFLFLAIVKHITGVQNYFVQSNLELTTTDTLTNVEFRVVEFDFAIRRWDEREDSSDDEMKEEREEEEVVEEEDDYESSDDDTTFTITLAADGTTMMDRPEGFTRITQITERGRDLTESEQLEELVLHVVPFLDLNQMERLASGVARHVSELREQAVVRAQHNSNFFNPTDRFSSGSEGEEEM